MTDYPIVRFVTALGDDTPRLDLNDADPFITDHDGFSFGAPTLESEPLSVGVPYGYRTITLPVAVTGDTDVAEPAIAALSVELLRRANWLMYQQDAGSDPLWVRTYASPPGELDFERVVVGDVGSQWRAILELPADSWLRAEQVVIGAQTITNDPTDSDGITIDLPDIAGDAPTPLSIRVTSDEDMVFMTWFVATAAVSTECSYNFAAPISLQTSHFTTAPGAPLGGLTSSSQAIGGMYRRTTNLPDSWTVMLQNPTGADIPVGNYRVLAKLRQDTVSGDAGTIAFSVGGRYDTFSGAAYRWQPETRHFPSQTWGLHDLGNLYLPVGARPDDPDLRGSRKFAFRTRAITGADPELDLGGFILIPIAADGESAVADSRILKANLGQALIPAGGAIHFDGDGQRIERNPRNLPLPNAVAAGGYPMVRPGYDNYLSMSSELDEYGSLTAADGNREFTITLSYHPLLLHPLRRT